MNWHIFCEVIDNYGDIGVSWRLAQQLSHDHSQQVTLWVDDLASFQTICPEVDLNQSQQNIAQVNVLHWQENTVSQFISQFSQATAVVEAFGCRLPALFIENMQHRSVSPAWINLEYLTAEDWAEECHLLPSPAHGLNKYFFFPGFSSNTGGLLWNESLLSLSSKMQNESARRQLFKELGITEELAEAALQISLFSYENRQVKTLLDALNQHHQSVHLLVPTGRIQEEVKEWLLLNKLKSLTVSIVPFMAQLTYDKLLATCQLNFVRGEESFVRAQMLGLPMIWHIYQQQDNAHIIKLKAFLERYLAEASTSLKSAIEQAFCHWNEVQGVQQNWPLLLDVLPEWLTSSQVWQKQQEAHGSLADNLVQFAQTRYSAQQFNGN